MSSKINFLSMFKIASKIKGQKYKEITQKTPTFLLNFWKMVLNTFIKKKALLFRALGLSAHLLANIKKYN